MCKIKNTVPFWFAILNFFFHGIEIRKKSILLLIIELLEIPWRLARLTHLIEFESNSLKRTHLDTDNFIESITLPIVRGMCDIMYVRRPLSIVVGGVLLSTRELTMCTLYAHRTYFMFHSFSMKFKRFVCFAVVASSNNNHQTFFLLILCIY